MATIERMAVVGAGQMGAGIAQVAAGVGIEVTLIDVTPAAVELGMERIRQSLAKLVAKEKLSSADEQATLGRLRAGLVVTEAKGVQFAVEAVTENEALKRDIFQELDRVAAPGAVLASNTSSIPITRLAAVTKRPDHVIGMHFMNPVPLMALVEIIRGAQTSDATYATTRALAERMGKTTIRSKDFPGFLVNRILIPMLNEACFVLQEGLASAEDIDLAMKLGCNHPMGPLQLADFVGLDTCLYIAEVLHRGFGEGKYRPAPLLRQYVDAGWLGKKSGRGFYRY